MALAARLPSPMARMTVAAPRTMSPPAKTPGKLVMPFSSATMLPYLFSFSSGQVAVSSGLARVPMATTTMSQARTNSDPATGSGRARPDASGAPSFIRTH